MSDSLPVSRTDAPDVADVRPGEELDWSALEQYVRKHIDVLRGSMTVRQFPKGFANLTYLLTFGNDRLVLRRPPFGTLAPGAHDMAREHRTLSRLWKEFPPAPRSFLHCADLTIVGAEFFVMEYRRGVGIWDTIPASIATHRDVGRRVGFAVIDALAGLHAVDPAKCDLAELGRPVGFVDRQLRGWQRRWDLVRGDAGAGPMDEAFESLQGSTPDSSPPTLLHNDLKLDNCQFDPNDPDRVRSVFDWDQATLGEPLIDPRHPPQLLARCQRLSRRTLGRHSGSELIGLPSRQELVTRYHELTGLDVGRLPWFEAFACWKTAVVRQQLFTRYQRGESVDARMATLGESVPGLARRALRLLREWAGADN